MHKLKGFSLVEVMVALGVVAVFGVLAFHAYRDYIRRAYFNEIIKTAEELKEPVTLCFQEIKKFKGCNSGAHQIPAARQKPQGSVASVSVKDGVITAAPMPWDGILTTDTFILTPRAGRNNQITWIPSGDGVNHGYGG